MAVFSTRYRDHALRLRRTICLQLHACAMIRREHQRES
jgi:hypothetical protein